MATPSPTGHGEVTTKRDLLYVISHSSSQLIFHVGANAEGSTLNITRISRKHMGKYRCDANNGIPPAASQIFKIEVHCELSVILVAESKLLIYEWCLQFRPSFASTDRCWAATTAPPPRWSARSRPTPPRSTTGSATTGSSFRRGRGSTACD